MSELTISQVLERAADLITPEGAWVQGVMGRDIRGRVVVQHTLSQAVCFCVQGAILRSARDERTAHIANEALRRAINHRAIALWNDRASRRQSEAVAALRKAAALARESGK